ncbi:12230_t:CDS:2, partial [Dentiscutata heterogama]
DVDKLGMYYEMKIASKILLGSCLLNLPCINICNPEDDDDRRKKTITDKLIDNIRNIFFGDVFHVDDFETFFKEVQVEEIEGKTEEKTIKIGKPKYTKDNFALRSLVKWNKFSQTTNNKKAPKAPRMKLRVIYSKFGFRIILNMISKDYGDFKVYKLPRPFIVTEVINSVDRPIDINTKIKEIQNFCVCELYEYTFKIPIYMAHDGLQEPRKDPRMLFCLPEKPTSDEILSFGCDKQKALQEKIDNTHLANVAINKDKPIDLEDALTGGAVLIQLIDAIKANNPIPSQPNKSIPTSILTEIII